VTRGQLPQRAGSLGLNGSGAAAAVPAAEQLIYPVFFHCSVSNAYSRQQNNKYQQMLQLLTKVYA